MQATRAGGRRWARRLGGAVAIAALAFGGALLTTGPAAAHDQLLTTDPADGATVQSLPAQITLTFNEDVLPDAGATIVEVTDAAGATVAQGAPAVSGAAVTQELASPADPNGAYSVAWKVVSSDGHPVSGTFAFTVAGAPVTTPTPTPTPTPTATPTPSPTAAPDSGYRGPQPWIWIPIVGAVLGGALLYLLVDRARRQAARERAEAPESESRPPADG